MKNVIKWLDLLKMNCKIVLFKVILRINVVNSFKRIKNNDYLI